jgi:hypothetical protein
MGSFTQNLTLAEPTPGDPAVTNSWGTILNTNAALIDSAVAGILALDVSGSSDVILTSISGQPDQARNARFVFSGVLTGNIKIFWPISLTSVFSVLNATTGAFSLTLAVNNGSGAPDGATVVIRQGDTLALSSNGTDILPNSATSEFASGTALVFPQASAPTAWTQDISKNDRVLRVVDTAGGGTGGTWTVGGLTTAVTVASHVLSVTELPSHTHNASGTTATENAPHEHPVTIPNAGTPGPFAAGAACGGATSVATGTESPDHTHTYAGTTDGGTGGGGGHTHAGSTAPITSDGTWRPSYEDVIVATKD